MKFAICFATFWPTWKSITIYFVATRQSINKLSAIKFKQNKLINTGYLCRNNLVNVCMKF